MIINLFSIFDPSSSLLHTSWLILPSVLILLTMKIWNTAHPLHKVMTSVYLVFNNEISYSLGNTENSVTFIIIISFILIIILNFPALYPHTFSATSHLTVNLPLSLIFWVSIIVFGWLNNTNHILSHLLPQGTPGALIIFMVIIELVSNMIRPITLCVRLTANLIAGHLLISLLGSALISGNLLTTSIIMIAPILLTILESAVACIQAYVFMTLVTLYTTEIN